MKILKVLVLLFSLSMPFVACDDKDEDVKPMLNVEQTNFSFSSKGETHTLKVVCNTEWTITLSDESWLTVSQTSGKGDCDVLLTAKENTLSTDRSALLTLKTVKGSVPVYISISQQRMQAFIKVNTKHLILGQYEFSEALDTVSSNYTCVVSSTPQWVKADIDSKGVIRVRARENNVSQESREGNIVLKANQMLDTIVVEQLPCIKSEKYVRMDDPLVLHDHIVTKFRHNVPVEKLGVNIVTKDEDAKMSDADIIAKVRSESRVYDYQSVVETQPWSYKLPSEEDFVVHLVAMFNDGKSYVNRYGYLAKPISTTASVVVSGGGYDKNADAQGYPYVFHFKKNKYCSHFYIAATTAKVEEQNIPFVAWDMRDLIRQDELTRQGNEEDFMVKKEVTTVLAWGEDDERELGGYISYSYTSGTRSNATSKEYLYGKNTQFATPGRDVLQSLDHTAVYKSSK